MRLVRTVISFLTLGLASPLLAQTALDRTTPLLARDEINIGSNERSKIVRVDVTTSEPTESIDQVEPGLIVGSIIVEGNVALSDSEFLDLIEQFSARRLEQSDLVQLADAVAQRARERGYIFASARILEQNIQFGVLRVQLDEGRIDEIRLEGARDPAIQRQLAPLVSGSPVTRRELERQILLADDISGVRILNSRFEMEGETGVLILRTRRSNASASVELRNSGSEPVGPFRARINVDLNGLLTAADEVDVTVGTTPFQPLSLIHI